MKTNGRHRVLPGVVAGAILIVAGFSASTEGGLLDGILKRSPADAAKAAGVVETADAVRIPLDSLDSGKALFLQTELAGSTLYYFAMKSSDGVYRAAFDACDVCFRMNLGFRQEGDLMVCKNCGQSFPSRKIGEVKGGCNPAPLARKIEGRQLVIKKSDISAGKGYFPGKRA